MALGLMVSDKKTFFYVCPYLSLRKACDPGDGAPFGPRGIIWTYVVEDH